MKFYTLLGLFLLLGISSAYLSNFTDQFSGTLTNSSFYTIVNSTGIFVSQSDALLINGTGTNEAAYIRTIQSASMIDNFNVSIYVNLTDINASYFSLELYNSTLSGTPQCKMLIPADGAYSFQAINSSGGTLDAPSPPNSYIITPGYLSMTWNTTTKNLTCYYGGAVTSVNDAGLSAVAGTQITVLGGTVPPSEANVSMILDMLIYGADSSCVDTDGDGYGLYPNNGLARGCTFDAPDCNDTNVALYQNLTGYVDADSDNWTVGTLLTVCSGAALPSGYRATQNVSDDCNDANGSIWVNMTGYPDFDSDLATLPIATVCTNGTLPNDYLVNASTFVDCNDADGNLYPPYENMSLNTATLLCNGTYNIPTSTFIIGFGSNSVDVACNNTIIIGNASGNAVEVVASTLNASIHDCTFQNFSIGLYAFNSGNTSFYRNNVSEVITGVASINTVDDDIFNNTISAIYGGIMFGGVNGADVYKNNITITGGGLTYGLSIGNFGGSDGGVSNLIYNNVFQDAGIGIYLGNSSASTLAFNNLLNATVPAYDNGSLNTWFISPTPAINIVNGPNVGGNYYSNYLGVDTNGDGFGDTLIPYLIPPLFNPDPYPLVLNSSSYNITVYNSTIIYLNQTPYTNITVVNQKVVTGDNGTFLGTYISPVQNSLLLISILAVIPLLFVAYLIYIFGEKLL